VSRRVKVPAVDELFRATGPLPERDTDRATDTDVNQAGRDRLRAVPDVTRAGRAQGLAEPSGTRRPTGRERHHEKITVYVSAEELLDLERARLTLRGEFGIAVDRGRLVREAVAVVLEEFDALGEASTLVRRLQHA